ncbi:hypothetical protein [Thauera humireducens]|uniref:hypothetical protein n=1 Tax=Thauera humireducens TaxID=1134435 RepID=UPI00311EDFEB
MAYARSPVSPRRLPHSSVAPCAEVDRAIRVQSFAEYSRLFGGLSRSSTMSYAVSHFFQHGGRDALIVRVFNGDADTDTATITLATTSGNLVLEAASPGTWGNRLRARVDHLTRDTSDTLLFNLTVEELDRAGGTTVVASEPFRNVSVSPGSARFVDTVLKAQSALVRVRTSAPADGVRSMARLTPRPPPPTAAPSPTPRSPETATRAPGCTRSRRRTSSTCCAFRRPRSTPTWWPRPGRLPPPTARNGARC